MILHDLEHDDVVRIGAREWGLLAACDGTRELEGVLVAARREGAHARLGALRRMLDDLHQRGMIVAGEHTETPPSSPLPPPASASSSGLPQAAVKTETMAAPEVTTESVAPAPAAVSSRVEPPRPLVAFAGGFHCRGGGTCCRLYGTVTLSRAEARRLKVAVPDRRVGPVPPERWTMPMRGSEPHPKLALITREGACGMLDDDELCAVHRAAGAQAKPFGCQLYPRMFFDDGLAVHVSLKPECPCILEPPTGTEEAVVDPAWTSVDALPPMILVDRLPDVVELCAGVWAPRAEVRQWFARLTQWAVPHDLATTMWALGRHVEVHGLGGEPEVALEAAPPPSADVAPWIDALHARAVGRAREHAAWRSSRDLVRRVSAAIALTTLVLRDADALTETLHAGPMLAEQERRYWETGLHGYRWAGGGSLSTVLADEAVRLWVARALPAVLPDPDTEPDFRSPLALVQAMVRAHGLGAYVDDLRFR